MFAFSSLIISAHDAICWCSIIEENVTCHNPGCLQVAVRAACGDSFTFPQVAPEHELPILCQPAAKNVAFCKKYAAISDRRLQYVSVAV